MKKTVLLLYLSIIILLLLAGSAKVSESIRISKEHVLEEFQENQDIPYIKYAYEGLQIGDENIYWEDQSNLTSTASYDRSRALGAIIVQDMDEYESIMQVIAAKEKACIEEIGVYKKPQEKVNSIDATIDDRFFESNRLVLIDYSFDGCPWLRSRLDCISINGNHVRVSIQIESVRGSCTNQSGEIYWIKVPVSCEFVDVSFEDTQWK